MTARTSPGKSILSQNTTFLSDQDQEWYREISWHLDATSGRIRAEATAAC